MAHHTMATSTTMTTTVRHIFEKHVESTLLLVEIHRCKICNFYSSHSGVMSDHVRSSHVTMASEEKDFANISEESSQQQDPDTPLKIVLNDIQNLQCLKSIPKDQVVLKMLCNSRTNDCGVLQPQQTEKEVDGSEMDLARFYDFLITESKLCISEKSSKEATSHLGGDTIERRKQIKVQALSPKVKSDKANSDIGRTRKDGLRDLRTKVEKKEEDTSIAASAIKLDFNRAYESMMAAAKLRSETVEEKGTEKGAGWIPEMPIVDKSLSSGVAVSEGQAPGSDTGQDLPPHVSSEPEAMSEETENVESLKQEKNPPQGSQTIVANSDPLPRTSTDEDMATSSLDKDQGQTPEDGPRPAPQTLPLVMLEGSKLYGSVDFQAIAQRASQSNPEATTITVVQHTGGSRPPTTIHFKKSLKSEAIIPTGESLGIESPFLRKEYTGSKIFACKECHSRYKTANELERHVVKKHQKKKSYLCEICGDALATRSGMKIHIMRKHADTKVLTCNVCDYMTRSSARLTIHQKKHSKQTSEFHCVPCKKSFVTASKLQQHKHSPMHKNAVDPIICEHCGYVTKKRDNFLVHIRKHTGEKPYRCNHCNYAAADGSTLKRHVMARHSSIRPFRCSQCQFSCVDKKGLTVHLRKHTGERPFLCDLCPYAAKRSGALTVHRRTHFHDNKTSVPSPKDDLTIDGGTEVASYVDISDLPITHVPLTSLSPNRNYPAQLSTHTPASSDLTSLPGSHEGMPSNQSATASVQLSAEVIGAQETDRSVGALWQSVS
eukprot:XP_011667351.1 PREDICTED: zinc finger protein 711 isoform X2 [Strongylocentrotus purpuratus]